MIAIVGTPVVASSGSASAAPLDSPALSTTNGNSLLVGCASQEGDFVGTTIDTVTDTAGNTFLPLTMQGSAGAGQIIRWFYCHNIIGNGANVASGAWSAATRYRHIIQIEFSGAKNQAPISEGGNAALGVSSCPVNIAMGSTVGAVFSMATSSNDRTWIPGTGFTEINDWGTSAAADYYTGFNATGTVTADMTPSAASNFSLVAVGFEQAGGPIIPPIIHHLRQQGIA